MRAALKENHQGFPTSPQPTSDLNPFTSYANLYFRPRVPPGLLGITEIEKTYIFREPRIVEKSFCTLSRREKKVFVGMWIC